MSDTTTKTKFDWKSALTSKGVWGSIVAVIATIAGLLGFDSGAVSTELLAIGGAALALYGRLVATRELFKKDEPQA
jgi:hypothetical protein